MAQLIMRWKNDGTPAQMPVLPEGFTVVTLPELDDAVEKWLDIMQYGLSETREDQSYYQKCMLDLAGYEEDKCFFILRDGTPVASITVVCNYETKEGLIHMVGSLPQCRGKGVGGMLGQVALHALKSSGMETAFLRTDDFRVPAIRSYLRMGFQPDVSTEEFAQRWDAVFSAIGLKN